MVKDKLSSPPSPPPPSPVKVVEEQPEIVPSHFSEVKEELPTEMLSGSPIKEEMSETLSGGQGFAVPQDGSPAPPITVDAEKVYSSWEQPLAAPYVASVVDGKRFGLPEGWHVNEKPRANPNYIGKVDQIFRHIKTGKTFRSMKAARLWILENPNEPGHHEFIAREEASESSKRPGKSTHQMNKATVQDLAGNLDQIAESGKRKRGRPRKSSQSSTNNAQDVRVFIPTVNSDEAKVGPDLQFNSLDDIVNHIKLEGRTTNANNSDRIE